MLDLTRRIMISAPRESVCLYLKELKNMPEYERKVEAISVTSADPSEAQADLSGKFLGLPWTGTFKFTFTADGGYRSEMTRGPLRKMLGGFHLRSVSGGTVLTHDEQYQLSFLLSPFSYFISKWVSATMDAELGVIKEGAERLNRKIQQQKIDSL